MRRRAEVFLASLGLGLLTMAPAACGESDAPGPSGGGDRPAADRAQPPEAPASASAKKVRAKRLADFDNPVEVRFAPGFPDLTFVVEQTGKVRVMRGGRKLGRPFVDLTGRIDYGGERGLLSIAFPPDYKRSKRFYAYYTAGNGDITVDEFRRASAVRANPGSRRNVISIPHRAASNHNGGSLQFLGNMLFFGTGDGGAGQSGNAQDKGSLLGKLIRIDPRARGGRPYSIPSDNPFVGRAGRGEIWAYGFRNPYRFSIDTSKGKPMLAIGDVGESEFEEVDYLSVGAARGGNFGWDRMEGFSAFDGSVIPGSKRPVFVYRHDGGNCSITGGLVVGRGGPAPLRGRYLYADFCKGQLRTIPARKGRAKGSKPVGVSIDSPSSFGADSRGRVYVTSLSGGLYRLGGG